MPGKNPQCGKNPLIKSSYYSSKVQQRKYNIQKSVKSVQSNYSQQDVLNRKSTLVNLPKLLLQINSIKPSQFGLQEQSELAQNNPEKVSQTRSTHSQTCGQHWSNNPKNLEICANKCGLQKSDFCPSKRSQRWSVFLKFGQRTNPKIRPPFTRAK